MTLTDQQNDEGCDPNADHHYNVGWVDAIDAAIRIVNEAREEGETELRCIRERIRGLKDMAQ